MSHFTRVSTKIKDLSILKKAVNRLGFSFVEGVFEVSKYGQKEFAQLKLDDDVGMSLQKDGTYSMVGDFYYAKNQKLRSYYGKTNKFAADLITAYSIEEAKVKLEEKNFYCTENEEASVGEDGLITMTFVNYDE